MNVWRHSPFVAIVSVLALAMEIGFTTTMFSIVRGATRPLPFHEPHELVAISSFLRPLDYQRWVEHARSFEGLGAYEGQSLPVAGGTGDPERISGAAITANTSEFLGPPPSLGRTLQAADMRAGAPAVVVLSHALWQRRYGADPDALGRTIRLGGVDHAIVGVMPQRYGFPINAAFWTPLVLDGRDWAPGSGPLLRVFGRLADGVSIAGARAELQTLISSDRRAPSAGEAPAAGEDRIDVVPFQDLETPREIIRGLYLLVVAVSFVLLIACGNVANLLIARAAVRARDVALRLALGATQRQLVREQLGEVLSLATVAAVLGVALAYAGTRLFAVNTSHIIEAFWVDFRVDGTVLFFAALLAAAATLASGLGPAMRVSRSNVADVLKDRSHGSTSLSIGRLSRGMIGVQVALACGLLALTMVLGRSAVGLHTIAWPFDLDAVMTFEFELTAPIATDSTLRAGRLAEIAAAVETTPGVLTAGLTTALPGRSGGAWTFALDAAPADQTGRRTAVASVAPGFFDVTGAHALQGRLLTWQDDGAAPAVAVVNESFARRFAGDGDTVGRRVFIGARDFTIVGVVPDLMARDVQDREQDGVYLSILQARPYGIRVMARAAGDPAAVMPLIRAALRRIDPDLPVTDVFTLREAVYRDKRVLDVLSTLFLVFGVGALSLTAIGLYGVVSFGVTQRTPEIGIRLALGATRAQVLGLVVRQGSRQLAIGLAVGMLLAIGLSRGFAAAVEQLPPADAPLLFWIGAAVALTAAAALVVPALRAARLQVLGALRNH